MERFKVILTKIGIQVLGAIILGAFMGAPAVLVVLLK